jgi:lysophospholipase L1-like esterase
MQSDGSSARSYKSPDSARLSITGDISVRVKLRPAASWASGVGQCLVGKFDGGTKSFRFELTSTGNLFMEISPDGTTQYGKTSTAVVPFASATDGWVRADVDVNNGASGWDVKFYTSTDGVTWTQLGTTVTTATATSIFDGTAYVEIGMRNGSAIVNGRLYAMDIYSGFAASSPLVASWRASECYVAYQYQATQKDVCGNLWTATAAAGLQGITGAPSLTILNASVSGMALGYFTDTTRIAKILAGRVKAAFISLSHNAGALYYDGDEYKAPFEAFIGQIRTAQPDTAIAIVGQNPKVSPATDPDQKNHRDRIRQLASVAALGGHAFIDVYALYMATGNPAALINVDGIHPTSGGQLVWAEKVLSFIDLNRVAY